MVRRGTQAHPLEGGVPADSAPRRDAFEAGAPNQAMRCLIVSPVRLLRDGLTMLLRQYPRVEAARTAASAADALGVLREFPATLVLLDIGWPDWPETLRQISTASAGVQVLGFAATDPEQDVLVYAAAGITGFVSRDASIEDLFDALDRAMRGELLCSPRVAGAMFRQLTTLAGALDVELDVERVQLTGREREIMQFIDAGLSNKEIAQRLRMGVSTVKNHVHRILEKLQVTRRGEAAARLRRSMLSGGSP